MKLPILNISGTEIAKVELPTQFNEPVRPDLIKKAVLILRSHKRQKYGAHTRAGKDYSAMLSKRRKKYRGCYGHGISRTPRKIVTRRGTRFNWIGALAPQTRGGRRAHPPKSEKNWKLKINKKERKKAIRSAISSTINRKLVESSGHIIPKIYPFILEDKVQDITKTKTLKEMFGKLNLVEELQRVSKRKIRAGKGKTRGRKYRTKKGPLIVVVDDKNLKKAVNNLPGVEVSKVENLNSELLAPGVQIGRLIIFTKGTLEKLEKEKLFI